MQNPSVPQNMLPETEGIFDDGERKRKTGYKSPVPKPKLPAPGAKAGLSYQPKTQRCVTPKASRMK